MSAERPEQATVDRAVRHLADQPGTARPEKGHESAEHRAPERLRSIGQLLTRLKADFPQVTISKIRFLESEGLIRPRRAPSGYRRYSTADEERLRYILRVQRDHYLPLKVIGEHLELIDRGLQPQPLDDLTPQLPPEDTPTGPLPERATPIRLARGELLEASGLSEAALVELERFQIVMPNRGTVHYGRDALAIARAAKRLAEFGFDARHLRAIKMSADREVGLVEQAIAPYVRRAGGNRELVADVVNHVIDAHAALVRTAFQR